MPIIGDKVKIVRNYGGYEGLSLPQVATITEEYVTGCYGCVVKINYDGIFKDELLAFELNEMELL